MKDASDALKVSSLEEITCWKHSSSWSFSIPSLNEPLKLIIEHIVFQEADNWTTLSADVDEVFESGDINAVSLL